MIPMNVMTIEELVDDLDLPRANLLGLAVAGRLPGEKSDGQWRFRREEIDSWLDGSAQDPHCSGLACVAIEATGANSVSFVSQ